jgi:hypothetical protein
MNDRDLIAQRILLHLMENPANHYINAADQATALTDAVLAAIGDRLIPDLPVRAELFRVSFYMDGGGDGEAEAASMPVAVRDALGRIK